MNKQHFELLCCICERPLQYVGGSSLPEVCAFIAGIDLATGSLHGFREWLATQLNDCTPERHWQSHVAQSVSENGISDENAVAHLGTLIREFHRFMNPSAAESSHRGLQRVYLHYHAWCVKRGYGPDFNGLSVN